MKWILPGILLAFAAQGAFAGLASAEVNASDPEAIPPHIVLRKSDCSPLPFNEEVLASRLRVELAEIGVHSIDLESVQNAVAGVPERRVTVTLVGACASGEITIVIGEPERPEAQRAIDVGGMDRAVRERSLALVITELLRARSAGGASGDSKPEGAIDADGRSSKPIQREEVSDSSPEEAQLADRDSSGLLRPRRADPDSAPTLLSAGIEWRFLLGRNTALTGGRLAASFASGSGWLVRVSGEAGAFYDSEEDGAGAIELWLVTGGLGVSGGYGWKRAEIGLGPRLELGWGYSRVAPLQMNSEPQSDSAAIVIASMVATGRVGIGPRLWLSMDLELGHVLRGLSARPLDRPPLGISGATGGGRLGVAVRL